MKSSAEPRVAAREKGRLPPRWVIKAFWHVHRRIVRASGGRKGLWAPRPGKWGAFTTPEELARIVTLDLIRILHHPTNRYGLSVTELELLNQHTQRLNGLGRGGLPEPGGAEGGGVLLDFGHREPVQGVALDERG